MPNVVMVNDRRRKDKHDHMKLKRFPSDAIFLRDVRRRGTLLLEVIATVEKRLTAAGEW